MYVTACILWIFTKNCVVYDTLYSLQNCSKVPTSNAYYSYIVYDGYCWNWSLLPCVIGVIVCVSRSYLIRKRPRWAWSIARRSTAGAWDNVRHESATLLWPLAPVPAPDPACMRNVRAHRWTGYRQGSDRLSRGRKPAPKRDANFAAM